MYVGHTAVHGKFHKLSLVTIDELSSHLISKAGHSSPVPILLNCKCFGGGGRGRYLYRSSTRHFDNKTCELYYLKVYFAHNTLSLKPRSYFIRSCLL